MLYKIEANTAIAWNGEALNEIRHPMNIETKWTTEELLAIGLHKVEPGIIDIPEGQEIDTSSIVIVGGVPEMSYTFKDQDIEQYRRQMECTKLQAKASLYEYGLLDGVEALIAQSDFITQLAWKEAGTFKRTSPVLLAMQAYLTWPNDDPITDEEIDALFERAMELDF